MEDIEQKQRSVQIGLRVPEKINALLDERADSIGISKNSLILVLINLGIKVFDSQINLVLPSE